ncbi:MAG: RNA-binding protein [Dongia sp.]|jgi:predicted RNA-binding protein YlxR (DUF448 family)
MDVTMAEAEERVEEAQVGAEASLRRCIVTREALEKDQLLRFVLGPEDLVFPDLAGKLPGRGAWVKAERAVLEQAVKKNAFAKAFQAPAKVAPDLAERVGRLLDQQILDLLGLARRSGLLATGFEKADAALRTGRAVLLIEAKDAGKEGRTKLARHTLPGVEIWAPLTADLLGRAIGRDHAVHVAVSPGGLAERLKIALRRQNGFSKDGLSGGGHSAASPVGSAEHE